MRMIFISTICTSAVIYLGVIKLLQIFNFVQLDSVNSWMERNTILYWILLLLILIVLSCLLFIVGQWLAKSILSAVIVGGLLSISAIFLIEGALSWHKLSVPLITCTILYCYFIFSTAYFHKHELIFRQPK